MKYAQVDWSHIAHTPDGVHVHVLDAHKLVDLARELMAKGHYDDADQAIADAVGKYAQAIREALGFPDDWISAPSWSSTVAPGIPDKLINPTIHTDLPSIES